MKSYYHAHETAYQQIKAKGQVGWGGASSLNELGDPKTQDFLRAVIAQWIHNPAEKSALDLGCGTGTTAFTMAKLGLRVTGVDISPTAIEMAKKLTDQQKLSIRFLVADLLHLENLKEKFDLIYDSHFLHCIVFDEDRRSVFAGVKESLTESGLFILDTMIMADAFDPTAGFETLRFDDDHILWHKTGPSADRGVVVIGNQHWCAQRRIYPPEKIMNEVFSAGFKLLSETLHPQEGNQAPMLRLVLKNS